MRAQVELRELIALVAVFVVACGPGGNPRLELDRESWRAWRRERVAELSAEDGWLTLIGLSWLQEDRPATFGTSDDADVVLPMTSSLEGRPSILGTFLWSEGSVVVVPTPDAGLVVGSAPAPAGRRVVLYDGDPAHSQSLEIGSVELAVIARAGEIGVRARDHESARRQLLARYPIETYPPSDDLVLDARFEPAAAGATLRIANVTGQVYDQGHPGTLVFELDGQELRLEALETDTDGHYFLLVGDQTNGTETYGGGRYLYVDRRADGGVDLDLNRLYNPPCVFTAFATCPLPPRANRLPIRIEGGEKLWHGDLAHG